MNNTSSIIMYRILKYIKLEAKQEKYNEVYAK